MAIIVPEEAERNILGLILGKTNYAGDKLYIGFTKTLIPFNESMTLTTLKNAANDVSSLLFTTPVEREVEIVDWAITSSGSGIATASEKVINLLSDASEYSIYGYYIFKGNAVDDATAELMWCESFPTPFIIPTTGGGVIRLTLRLELE